MDFHFIKLNYNGTYLSLVDPNSKSRFVCFSDKDMAMKCVDYAAEFRARNRIWPSLDMSSENRKLELNEKVKFPYCLLYTSPSPRDATLSRMPSSA